MKTNCGKNRMTAMMVIGVLSLEANAFTETIFSSCSELSCLYSEANVFNCKVKCGDSVVDVPFEKEFFGDGADLVSGISCLASRSVFNCEMTTVFGPMYFRIRENQDRKQSSGDFACRSNDTTVSCEASMFGHDFLFEMDIDENPEIAQQLTEHKQTHPGVNNIMFYHRTISHHVEL